MCAARCTVKETLVAITNVAGFVRMLHTTQCMCCVGYSRIYLLYIIKCTVHLASTCVRST